MEVSDCCQSTRIIAIKNREMPEAKVAVNPRKIQSPQTLFFHVHILFELKKPLFPRQDM